MDQRGATLAELMVVLAIGAILLTLGIPGFATLIEGSRLSSATNELISTLHLARSEAIKRNARTVLCKSVDGSECNTSGGWHQGWLVFHDANNNGLRDDGETIVLVRPALPDGIRVTGNSPVFSYISYAPTGGSKLISGGWQGGTLTVCSDLESLHTVRQIIISKTGRPRSARIEEASCP